MENWKIGGLKNAGIYRLIPVIIFAFLFGACANEVAPQGGKKDTEPPKAKKMTPANKTLRFTGNTIEITFDEFIKPTGFAKTLISPPLDKRPDFKVEARTLTIKFKSPLTDSTTYTINFAEDVQDLNEGNKATNFTYVFSTGDFIDSQKVSGKVFFAKDNTTVEDVIVSLYPADSLNGIKTSKPLYFTKADKSGNFEIKNVKANHYRIFALKDQNYDYLYNQPGEMIAFLDSAIDLTDTCDFPKVELALFDENKKKPAVTGVRSIAPGFIQITYIKPVKSFKLESEPLSESDFASLSDTNDTINYWYSKYYLKKAELFLVANDSIRDTSRIELKIIPKDSLYTNSNYWLTTENQLNINDKSAKSKPVYNVQELYKALKIKFTRPIAEVNESKDLCVNPDSSNLFISARFEIDTQTKQLVRIDFDKKENTNYTLEIPDSMFRDIFGTWNRKYIYKFGTNGKDNYGNLHITLKTEHPDKYYVIKLLNSNNETVKQFFFSGNGERKVTVSNILAGSYKFVVIDDANQNGVWDTGDFDHKIQPEKIYNYKESYVLKGGWDLDAEVKF